MHVDDIFAVGDKSSCHQFCEDLKCLVPNNDLGELRWYGGCPFLTDWDGGTFMISQQAFAQNTAARFGISYGRNKPLSTGLKLEKFDGSKPFGGFDLSGVMCFISNSS